ncbi:hypothetical protein KJ632_00145, partial [Patescibacteria group bacterium]|nr:hypothetical protein [Patescibacteria group bacterium]
MISNIKNRCIWVLLFMITFTQIIPYPVAYSLTFFANPVPVAQAATTSYVAEAQAEKDNHAETYGLVAIVVDDSLVGRDGYTGLGDTYSEKLNEYTILGRVRRYADDIVRNNDYIDTKILYFDKDEQSVQDLAAALENLYINGTSERNRLAGAIFVGDIPLPVVNKNGNRYVSVFPLTDFEDKAFIYDPQLDIFNLNAEVAFPKPEIWHGVIKAPNHGDSDDQREVALNEMAKFFDKNHLYYLGVPEYADFNKKLFFGDLVHEEEKLFPELYAYYMRYLDSLEDQAFNRYNKFWASEITQIQMEGVEMAEGSLGASMVEGITSGDMFKDLPDIYSKQIIDQALSPYANLTKKYISQLNNWVDYTGRYNTQSVSNIPTIMTMKDEYSKLYLKNVSLALEKAIDTVVDEVQEPLPILEYSKLTGQIGNGAVDPENEDGASYFEVETHGAEDAGTIVLDGSGEENALYMRYHYVNAVNGEMYVNGISEDIIDSPKLCSFYLGSTKEDYFDENNVFDPKSVGGDYSV